MYPRSLAKTLVQGHSRGGKVVADDQAPIWHNDIYSHQIEICWCFWNSNSYQHSSSVTFIAYYSG